MTNIPGYASIGSFEKVADYFSDPSAREQFSEFEQQKAETKFNPPLPTLLDASRYRNNPRGFIMRDPMPITGYAPANASSETGEATNTEDIDDNPGNDGDDDKFLFDAIRGESAYGFRFLMNPTNFSEGFSNTSNVDPIAYRASIERLDSPPVPIMSGATMSFELLLTRVDDMRILRMGDDVSPQYYFARPNQESFQEMKEGILTRGTMYDVEYLFRTVNGKRFPVWWNDTPSSDWGALLPRPIIVSMGDTGGVGYSSTLSNNVFRYRRIRGILSSVSISHMRFAPGMVPILTKVAIEVERFSDALWKGMVWDEEDVDSRSSSPPIVQAWNWARGLVWGSDA